MTDQNTTRKTYGLLAIAENELTAARTASIKAYEAYTTNQTAENKTAMHAAEQKLAEVRKSYDDARRALNVKVSERMTQARGS